MFTFSLLHPTARLPEGWMPAALDWCAKADDHGRIEYVLVPDRPGEATHYFNPGFGRFICEQNEGKHGSANAWNVAARISTGNVLVCVADDYFPTPHWDSQLLDALIKGGGVYREQVLWQDSGHHEGLMIFPILTRAYYERPGRGGCKGNLFYPEYISMGADDDFTEYACLDGVVLDCRDFIKFDHRHPTRDLAPDDEVYQFQARPEAWEVKERVIARRRAEGYSR